MQIPLQPRICLNTYRTLGKGVEEAAPLMKGDLTIFEDHCEGRSRVTTVIRNEGQIAPSGFALVEESCTNTLKTLKSRTISRCYLFRPSL